ncbi:glycosyltransferase family 2 protein [Methylopila musalis]|uniref:Glycosyltransferase family 2 protein n=1 Tax=Methylopila musalis TaxID=1134781 RepID=A0ABW3ZC50_9HYPH
MTTVSIVIPTLTRPEPLRRALESALAQGGVEAQALEVVVVDNSAAGDARALVERFAAASGGRVRYVAAPRPGVANARNAGVAAATGDWIAFLDDDQEASPRGLANHLAAVLAAGADASFGPVEARAEGGAPMGPFTPYFERRIARPDGADITELSAYLGTNNSMFRRARCLEGEAPFDVTLNESGGEDSLLIKRLRLSGRAFAWAAQASVIEWTPPRRLTWAYVRKRKFLSGQVRSFVHHMLEPPQWGWILLWMAVGLVQAAGFGALALVFRPIDATRSEKARATAMGGLGKVLWMRRFRPALYGSGLVS